MKPGDDESWLERLKCQDEQAQRDFCDLYYRTVYHRARAEARNHDSHDAEDITHETFIRAFRDIQKFKGKSSLKVWLIPLCKNAAADFYRRPAGPTDSKRRLMMDMAPPAGTPAPLKRSIENELNGLLQDGLATLSPEQREVVEHRMYEGLNVAETAEVMKQTEGAVKMALSRALKKLALYEPLAEEVVNP